jgi:hypothetical protein
VADADGGAGGKDAVLDREDAQAEAGLATTVPITQRMQLQYQLVGTLDEVATADLFVIDLFESEPSQIASLHERGRVVVAYVSAGSSEPWRPDVGNLSASAIGEPLAGHPDEAWLDVRDASVRQMLLGRLKLAANKGFDGVLLCSLDAYLHDSGHDLDAADQLAYSLWLAEQASALDLAAGASSDWAQAPQLSEKYDFAIHFNCLANGSCAELKPYRARKRPVFDLETTGSAEQLCADARALDLPVTLKDDSFGSWFHACP